MCNLPYFRGNFTKVLTRELENEKGKLSLYKNSTTKDNKSKVAVS
jgi:hypothetical protein